MKVIRQIATLAVVLSLFTAIFAGLPWFVIVAEDPVVPWWLRLAVFSLLGGILVVLLTLALEQRKHGVTGGEMPRAEGHSQVALVNTEDMPGQDIAEVLGLVQGHTVFAVWLGKDLSAVIRLVLGGELTEYTEMMGRARVTATSRMQAQATEMGADAIVNVRYMTTSVVATAAELFAYGTAVKLRK